MKTLIPIILVILMISCKKKDLDICYACETKEYEKYYNTETGGYSYDYVCNVALKEVLQYEKDHSTEKLLTYTKCFCHKVN